MAETPSKAIAGRFVVPLASLDARLTQKAGAALLYTRHRFYKYGNRPERYLAKFISAPLFLQLGMEMVAFWKILRIPVKFLSRTIGIVKPEHTQPMHS